MDSCMTKNKINILTNILLTPWNCGLRKRHPSSQSSICTLLSNDLLATSNFITMEFGMLLLIITTQNLSHHRPDLKKCTMCRLLFIWSMK